MNPMKYYVDDSGSYLGGWDANPPDGAIEVPTPPDDARQVWDGETWGDIPEPSPLTIELPRREFRRALLHNGMDTAAVLSVINAITDPEEREEMTIWWEDTQNFQRQHPVLVQMVAAAGLTPEQGDVIWAYGVGLLQGE